MIMEAQLLGSVSADSCYLLAFGSYGRFQQLVQVKVQGTRDCSRYYINKHLFFSLVCSPAESDYVFTVRINNASVPRTFLLIAPC